MNSKHFRLAAALILSGIGTAFAQHEKHTHETAKPATNAVVANAQTKCPVMGGDVDKTKFVDYDGKRIYVCCGGCIAKIKKDPAKYVKQLEAEGVTLDKAEPPKAK